MGWTPEMRAKSAETRRRNAEAKAATAQGVGESRIFRDPDGPDPYAHLRDCHINDRRIGDFMSESEFATFCTAGGWWLTDEGIAERNVGKSEVRAEVIRGPLDNKKLERRDQQLEGGRQSWEYADALKETADQYAKSGMRPKFLSTARINKEGSTRGYVIAKQDNGDPVRLGADLVLGHMPEEKAQQRNKFYRAKSEQSIALLNAEMKEKQDKYERDAGLRSSSLVRSTPDPGADGLHSVRGNVNDL